jgi:hypothetical protein
MLSKSHYDENEDINKTALFFEHFPVITQDKIIKNFNHIADTLKHLKLQKLSTTGLCFGLTVCYALYVKEGRREEFIRCLQFISALSDGTQMSLFISAADKILENENKDVLIQLKLDSLEKKPWFFSNDPIFLSPISFKTVCRFLKEVSLVHLNQSLSQINPKWDSTYSFICEKQKLSIFFENRNIQDGDIAIVTMGVHTFYIERAKNGFYLFEPNFIYLASLLPVIKDETALATQLISAYEKFKWLTENNLMTFSLRFITFGNKNRKLDDILIKFRKEEPNHYKSINTSIDKYHACKYSRFELALALLEDIHGLKQKNNANPEMIEDQLNDLTNLEKKLIKFAEPGLFFQAQTIQNCQKYINEPAFDKKIYWSFLAIRENEISLVKKLLKKGANPNAESQGVSLLGAASAKNNVAMMQLLLAYGALLAPSQPDGFGIALHGASESGSMDALNFLIIEHLGKNIDLDFPFEASVKILLKQAEKQNRRKEVEELILMHTENKVLPDILPGVTPLHLALLCGKKEAAEKLIEAGAKSLEQPLFGISMMEFAKAYHYPEIIKLIEEKVRADETLMINQSASTFKMI